jgi:hypothetical protein
MGTIGCNEFINQLEMWMEGERSAGVLAHLEGCPRCRDLVSDLDSIRVAAHSMEAADAAPPERVWVSLRAQLEQEELILTDHRDWVGVVSDWLDGVFSAVPRPALAGAYLVALAAISVALSLSGSHRSDQAQVSTQPLSAQLNTVEQDTASLMANVDPVVSASLQRNLQIVDNYIALCEKSVQEEPDSEAARDYLYEAYRQKAGLLEQMTERGEGR